MKRRQLIKLGAAGLAAAALGPVPARAAEPPPVTSAEQAMALLKAGNQRHVEGRPERLKDWTEIHRQAVAERQTPFAAIVSCADSRVAPEIAFDAGVGDLFVVRLAGVAISPAQYGVMGSLEYGVAVLNTPLMVVLGHSGCGAVDAAMASLEAEKDLPGSIQALADALAPAARRARGMPGNGLDNAIREGVRLSMHRLETGSSILREAVAGGRLKITGGVYDLKSGQVTWL